MAKNRGRPYTFSGFLGGGPRFWGPGAFFPTYHTAQHLAPERLFNCLYNNLLGSFVCGSVLSIQGLSRVARGLDTLILPDRRSQGCLAVLPGLLVMGSELFGGPSGVFLGGPPLLVKPD